MYEKKITIEDGGSLYICNSLHIFTSAKSKAVVFLFGYLTPPLWGIINKEEKSNSILLLGFLYRLVYLNYTCFFRD